MKEFFLNQEIINTQETSKAQDPGRVGYRIYIRSSRRWVPVSKEYYETYMREVGAYKKKQYRQGLCKCPGTKEYMCDCDCLTCPFYKKDVIMSLDAPIIDDEGNKERLMDCQIDENTLSPEEVLLVKNERESLYKAIDKLCEEDRILILMTLAEKSQIEIAEALGLKRQSNVRYRKLRALGQLKTLLIGKEGFLFI